MNGMCWRTLGLHVARLLDGGMHRVGPCLLACRGVTPISCAGGAEVVDLPS